MFISRQINPTLDEIGAAAFAPEHRPLSHVFADDLSAMGYFSQVECGLGSGFRMEADQGDA